MTCIQESGTSGTGDIMAETENPVQVENLHKAYGALTAVSSLTFHVSEGEVYSLLGPNGAGKTTTVEIIEGIRKADSGKVSVLGANPWKSPDWIRKSAGIMPQDFRFIERITPSEAIKYYSSLFGVRDRSRELIDLVELGEVENNQFQNLSGGEKQKVGICLALINDPKLIFLDEPTTGLDPRARRKIWKLISNLKSEGRTVILTTHYLEEAQMLADRVGIVNRGKMLVEGTPRSIIDRMGRGRRLVISRNDDLKGYIENTLGMQADTDADEMYIHVRNNRDIIDILAYLEQNSVEVKRLSMQEDTLEDVFVDLVGKQEDEE